MGKEVLKGFIRGIFRGKKSPVNSEQHEFQMKIDKISLRIEKALHGGKSPEYQAAARMNTPFLSKEFKVRIAQDGRR